VTIKQERLRNITFIFLPTFEKSFLFPCIRLTHSHSHEKHMEPKGRVGNSINCSPPKVYSRS